MMGISWMELMVIVMIALIVIGPKDLPAALRTLGQILRGVRRMAREFQIQMDQFVRESEIDASWRDIEDTAQDSATMRASPGAAGETVAAPRPSPAPERVPASPEIAAPKNFAPKDADP
jgi:Tat protein translocase TatB subunit